MTRLRLPGLLVGLAALLAACSGAPGSGPSPEPAPDTVPATESTPESTPETSPEPTVDPRSCRSLVDAMDPAQRAGQVFMVAVTNGPTPDSATMQVITDHQIGNVLLLGNSTGGVAHVREFTDDIRLMAGAEVLIAVDQEGGQVQRLQGPGFDRIPDAVEQATAPDLMADAQRWGEQLAEAGVDVNLAPVADVVPAEMTGRNAPIGQLRRGYGSDPEAVGEAVTDFVSGMHAAGVGTSLKHFPGLGRVVGNPDFADRVIDDQTTRDDPGLAGFRAGVDADASMVMVSSATYTKIDPDHQGVFSTVIMQEMIRDELGFDGVVISDDLGVAENLAAVPVEDRGWRFIAAGGDLVINADPAKARQMSERLVAEMDSDPDFAEQVADSATRVLELKAWLGRVDCAP